MVATLPSGQLILVTLPPGLIAGLPANLQLDIRVSPEVVPPDSAVGGSLGGGDVIPLGPPVYIRMAVTDTTTGAETALPPELMNEPVDLWLPVLDQPTSADQQFAWLREADIDGQFAGYFRDSARFDPSTNSLVRSVPAGLLTRGALFLPVFIVPAFVQNFNPDDHIFSSPFPDGVDFGVSGPQFTTYTVVAPQIADRIYVFNSFTADYGWIVATGVGPVGPPQP
jgi:hypothetical protein